MTKIIDKNTRGSRAPVTQTAHFRQKVKQLWFPNAPLKTLQQEPWMELTFKNHVGNQTAQGFDHCDRRNDNEDCVREIGGEFSPRFHRKQLCVRFVRRRGKSLHSLVPQHPIEYRNKQYFQIPSFGGCISGLLLLLIYNAST